MKTVSKRILIYWVFFAQLAIHSMGWSKEIPFDQLEADNKKAIQFIGRLNHDDQFLESLPDVQFFPSDDQFSKLNEADVISAIYDHWSKSPKVKSSGATIDASDFVTLYRPDYTKVSIKSAITPLTDRYLTLSQNNQLAWKKLESDWQPPIDLETVSIADFINLQLELDRIESEPVAITSFKVHLVLNREYISYRAAVYWIEYDGVVEPFLIV